MTRRAPLKTFRHLSVRGGPEQLGWQQGNAMRERIRQVLQFYRGLFGLDENDLLDRGRHFGEIITRFNPHYGTEIEALAAGAKLDERLVFALNSRSEIFNNLGVAECTSVINGREALLAQNWDWSQCLEPLVVDLAIERPDGHRIRMLTEPGIIGKIGMNSAGLGVCLNILSVEQELSGLPVHVLLRAILDASSLAEAAELMNTWRDGKASHILVGDAAGESLSVEFGGEASHRLRPEDGLILHTNHYLAGNSPNNRELFPSTHERMEKARSMMAADDSPEAIRSMLLDQSEQEFSICRPYSPSAIPGFGPVGTVFTVLMDLRRGAMEVRAGSQPDRQFYRIHV
jgi:isopenicillin-N N-acyltransferase-like protein